MSTLAEAAHLVELPDAVVAEYGVTVVSYLDEDGEQCWGYATHGDGSATALVGLLVSVQHCLMHDANPTPCEED